MSFPPKRLPQIPRHLIPFQVQTLLSKSLRKLPRGVDAVDSNWYFMVNGEGYKGWLTDTDGHRYYFNDKGVMQTGWLELDGKRYYLNADESQTGDVT